MPLTNHYVSAGFGYEVGDDYELLDVNHLITNGRDSFIAMRVDGDSMVDAVPPGSLVFLDTFAQPRNGDIVVVVVNGQNCVKYWSYDPPLLTLVSANKKYPPMRVTKNDSVHCLGVVKGCLSIF